jgi:L-2-hydroxyglutarate oxidase
LLVASTLLEVERMKALYERSQLNGMKVDAYELQRREPNIVGPGGLLLDATGIVDYRQVCETMARVVQQQGGEICLNKSI